MTGLKLLVVQPLILAGKGQAAPRVAVDTVGAGVGEKVLVAEGSPARAALDQRDLPVDAVIVAIVDTVEIEKP
jgi:ethanolamine utilization protein EutN